MHAVALVVAALALVMPHETLAAASPQPAASQAQTKLIATAKVEVKTKSGKVLKARETVAWDEDATVQLDKSGHVHAVTLNVSRRDDNGRRLSVRLSYQLDGEPIIADFQYDTKAKKREVLRTEGGLALAITVAPKRIKIDAPKPRPDEIEGPGDADNPLDGLE